MLCSSIKLKAENPESEFPWETVSYLLSLASWIRTVHGGKLWDRMSAEMKQISSISLFKKRQKEMILQRYLDE